MLSKRLLNLIIIIIIIMMVLMGVVVVFQIAYLFFPEQVVSLVAYTKGLLR